MGIAIRQMTADDIPTGMRFKAQYGWNTLPDDWHRQLDLEPEGCFVAEDDGQVVGTACACVFDNVAWVNLVLVAQVHRRRGIATNLMRYVLAWLDERKVSSIRLDATPVGRPVYEKLGFVTEYELTRYQGNMPALPVTSDAEQVTLAQTGDLPMVARFDESVTGTNRAKLIRYLRQRVELFVVRGGEDIVGYAAFRPGSTARHIGPCLGEADACRKLLAALTQVLRGDFVCMDVPLPHAAANAYALALGLTAQRQFTRMGRGVRVQEKLDQCWCSFGPEKG
jgi:GNAT superfamily N-acetyltransferase